MSSKNLQDFGQSAADMRISNPYDCQAEIDAADELGMTVSEYYTLQAEFSRKQAIIEADAKSGASATRAREEQASLRRMSGLPDNALPHAIFGLSNGGLRIFVDGLMIDGQFTLDSTGKPVGPGVHKSH